jgi:hypothetical protein
MEGRTTEELQQTRSSRCKKTSVLQRGRVSVRPTEGFTDLSLDPPSDPGEPTASP